MDNALNALFSWQFILFSLGVFVITWIIRTVVEYFIPKADGANIWEKLILPLMPPIMGTVVGYFARKYAYPDGLTTISGRLLFGSVAGMFSGLMYQVVKGTLKDKIQTLSNSVAGLNTQLQPPNVQGPNNVPFGTMGGGNK